MIPTAALRQRITIEPYLGNSAEGPVYGAPTRDVPARVVHKVRTIRTSSGVDITTSADAEIRPDRTVPQLSRVTDGERQYVVLHSEATRNLTRDWSLVLLLGDP